MLIVVRHGRTAWNAEGRFQGWAGVGLDTTGIEQAGAGARAIAGVVSGSVELVSSDLRRAVETAVVVAEVLQTVVSTDPSLREVDCGTWQGLTGAEAAARYPDEYRRWKAGEDVRRGGGETYSESGSRVARSITGLMRSGREGTVIVVGHGKSLQWGLDRLAERRYVDLPGPAPHLGNGRFLVLPDWRHDQNDSALSER